MRAVGKIRLGELSAHLGLAVLVVVGVFAQVYLIGAYVFGAGSEALDAHRTVGFTVHAFEVLILLAALHPLGALFVLVLAAVLVRRDLLLRRGLVVRSRGRASSRATGSLSRQTTTSGLR